MHASRVRHAHIGAHTYTSGDSPGSLSVWLPLVALLLDAVPRLSRSGAFGAREVDSFRPAVARARPTGSPRERAVRGRTEGTRGGSLRILSTSAYEAMPRRLNAGGLGRDVV